MTWSIGPGSQSKVGLAVTAFECLSATVSVIIHKKILRFWSKSDDYKWCETVKIDIYKIFDTLHPVWCSLYFLLFNITCHDMI